MKKIEEIENILEGHKKELRRSFYVREIGVFGSYVRNEQDKKSDVDILVEFSKPVGLFTFMDLEEHLSKILKIKVDLVTKRALKPYIGKHILREVVYI